MEIISKTYLFLLTYSNVSEQEYEELLSMYDVKLHVLTPGKKYDLVKKAPFEEEV